MGHKYSIHEGEMVNGDTNTEHKKVGRIQTSPSWTSVF